MYYEREKLWVSENMKAFRTRGMEGCAYSEDETLVPRRRAHMAVSDTNNRAYIADKKVVVVGGGGFQGGSLFFVFVSTLARCNSDLSVKHSSSRLT